MNDTVNESGSSLVEQKNPQNKGSTELAFAQEVSPLQMIAMAVQNGMEASQMQQLMDLADRQEAKIAKQEYTKAMSLFKANAPKIVKDTQVKFGNTDFKHASLAQICEKVGIVMSQFGLSHAWAMQQEGPIITVKCTVTHNLGHSESTSLSASPDTSGNKNPIQAIGSAVSYLERYTLLAITGLSTHENDDDGAATGEAGSAKDQPKTKPFYPDKSFESNFPEWSAAIAAGKKTKSHLIDMISTKAVVTDEQRKRINAIHVEGASA